MPPGSELIVLRPESALARPDILSEGGSAGRKLEGGERGVRRRIWGGSSVSASKCAISVTGISELEIRFQHFASAGRVLDKQSPP